MAHFRPYGKRIFLRLDIPPAVADCAPALKSDNPAKHFIIPLLIALVIYAVAYGWIEHRRTRKGPWVVAFANSTDGPPAILINQPKVGVTNVQIVFTGETVPPTNSIGASALAGQPSNSLHAPRTTHHGTATLVFDQARAVPFDVPFGQCIFMDPTFLPGTLTFSFFGHEIELLPRVLMIDHREHPWQSGEIIRLPAGQAP